MGRLDKVKLEDMISKVHSKPKHITRESQIPSKFEVAKFDTGGKLANKLRKHRWKEINRKKKKGKLKLKKIYNDIEKEQKKKKQSQLEKVRMMYSKADWLLQHYCTKGAYNLLETVRKNEPQVYKQIFQYLVPPTVLTRLDAYMQRVRAMGKIPNNKKIRHKRVLKLYRKITGRKSKVMVEKKGKKIEIRDAL